jgi:hypothetical protein
MSALTHRKLTAALLSVCAVLGAVVLTGCGGSGQTSRSHATAQAPSRVGPTSSSAVPSHETGARATKTPAASSPDVGSAAAQGRHGPRSSHRATGAARTNVATGRSHPDAATGGSHTDAAASAGSGVARSTTRVMKSGEHQKARLVSDINDDSTGTATHRLNPCSLVSLPQARTFTGTAISSRFEAPQGPTCIYRPTKAKDEVTLAVESIGSGDVTNHLSQRQKLTVAGRTAYCGKLGRQLLVVPLPGGQLLSVSASCSVARRFAEAALVRLAA